MSRIVAKLNLNKTPQLVENNSLIMAKNIRLLEDGTIGPDTSLEEIETKVGTVHQTTVHHDAVTKEITDYKYTILDYDHAIVYYNDPTSLDGDDLNDDAFDFINYGPNRNISEETSETDKYVEETSANECVINCYNLDNESIYWSTERFRYDPNEVSLINNNGYRLYIAVYEDYYNYHTSPPTSSGLEDFYYIVLPKELYDTSIVIEKYPYIVLNPVYPTSETETIIITPAYDQIVKKYDTIKYIGQIVGLNNKIYFFKEQLSILYSDEVFDVLEKEYPGETFVDEPDKGNKEATFDVNSEGYVTRRGILFEEREIAEIITPSYFKRVKIVEYDEVENTFKIVKCAWSYSGGKINGCVTVNNTGEPILTICEYDTPDDKLVPIKHINLSKCKLTDNESQYTQAPNIPITNLINVRRYTKNIPAGVYQFFIRYKIHDNFYTTWFPCSKELFAATIKQTDTLQSGLKHIDLHLDSNYSFIFQVQHLFSQYCKKYEQYQLGFIISSDGGVFARSWKHFDMVPNENNEDIYFEYNQEDIEEIDINEFLKVNFDIFNVSNVTQHKNKLYISNYKETDFNEPLDSYAKQINVEIKQQDIFVDSGYDYYFTSLPLHETATTYSPAIYDRYGDNYISETFGKNNFCILTDDFTSVIQNTIQKSKKDYMPSYGQVYGPEYDSVYDEYYSRINDAYIRYNGNNYSILSLIDVNEISSWNNNVIIESFIQKIRNRIIGIDASGNYKANINGTIINVSNIHVTYTTYTIVENNDIYVEDEYSGEIIYGGWDVTPIINTLIREIELKDILSTSPSFEEGYNEYNTLLPFTKYDFYVHYVKQNGITTNGYFICTKEMTRYSKGYKQINNLPSGSTAVEVYSLDIVNDISLITPYSPKYIRYNNNGVNEIYELTEDGLTDKSIIYPSFSNIKCPPGYVGCFISISQYGNKVAQGFNYDYQASGKMYVTRLDCLELDCLLYNKLSGLQVYDSKGNLLSNSANYYSSSTTESIEYLGCSGCVEFVSYDEQTVDTKCWIIFESSNKPYNKTLIKITPYINIKSHLTNSYSSYNDVNTPGYFCEVRKLDRQYCNAKNTDGSTNTNAYYVSGNDVYQRTIDQGNIDLEEIDEHLGYHYHLSSNFIISNFNLNYVSLTQDLNPIIRRYNVDESVDPPISSKQFITVVDSLICSFILELKSYYKDYTRKLYYEYTKNKLINFDNTIRASSIDVDETYRYIYRFEATDYYNVPTNRGIITNLFAISNSVYVHCEHSLFKFSDNKSLNTQDEEVSLQENDIFNSGITEVFDAQYGYAGLKNREQSLVTFNAYVFYDDVAKTIYAFGGEQQIGSISQSIKKLIDTINPTDVRFVGDEFHNRFFVNLISRVGNVCLSFNFNAKSFISIHDFNFKFGFHSRRHTYFIHEIVYDEHPMGWSIYRIADYIKTLIGRGEPTPIPDPTSQTYKNNYIAYQSCYKRSLVHIPDCDDLVLFNEVKSANACVDIIVNTEYEKIKALNYISWICSEILRYGNSENNIGEEVLDRKYPGTKIRIYSDSTETALFELLDSNGNPKIANENRNIDLSGNISPNSRNWQYPQYNCGIWSMNYFRDVRNILDIFEYMDSENNLIGEQGDSETTNLMPYITRKNLTQENSLLYGKYFVVRFIFNNKNFKLENVILRMNDYEKSK